MTVRKQPKVQAAQVTYELHSLGWKEFQKLCVSVVGEVWGQVVQSFSDSHDGGRDGAFHGKWKAKSGESFQGTFTVQCKFTSTADKTLRLPDLSDELVKAKRLSTRGLAENYFLLTNAGLTGSAEQEIKNAFEAIPGINHFAAFGKDRISQIIRESSRLRMLVPRVYGLGDLSQILDERAYSQALEILSSLGDSLSKFVITDPFLKSAKALVNHGFVLLLGEPASGKSTIAAALAVGALDKWGCSTIKIRNADDFVKHSNPHEPKQFFWVDDAFGPTQLDLQSAVDWNRVFPHVQAAIRRGAKVLFTSRNYVYRSARDLLKESAFPLINESQVVIHVEDLTKDEREQILYNHIRLGTQHRKIKTQLKPLLPNAANHSGFSPEIARRLGDPIFTKNLNISKSGLDDFISRHVELLLEVIRTIDASSRSALVVVFMRGGNLPSPMNLTNNEERAVTLMGGTVGGVLKALSALDGSLISQIHQEGRYFWRFKHPTIRDAFALLVSGDRELMDIYLTGTPLQKLFGEVSCGDVGIEGVKVIVPPERYEGLMERIEGFHRLRRENEDTTNLFLAHRCDRDFLYRFIDRNPDFIKNLRIGSYLYSVSYVDVFVRLHDFNLLPEPNRLGVVAAIRGLAVDTPNAGFLNKEIRRLFTDKELQEILDHVKSDLLPNLNNHIDNWRANYNGTDDPDNYFYELQSALEEFKTEFKTRSMPIQEIDSALEDLGNVIEELRSEMPEDPESDDFYGRSPTGNGHNESRSIFDDVDE